MNNILLYFLVVYGIICIAGLITLAYGIKNAEELPDEDNYNELT